MDLENAMVLEPIDVTTQPAEEVVTREQRRSRRKRDVRARTLSV